MVSSFPPVHGEVEEDISDVTLSKLDNVLTTLAESRWPSGILFYTVCFQGIFPVWTRRGRGREGEEGKGFNKNLNDHG